MNTFEPAAKEVVMDIAIKRVYEKPTREDGYRILVDRLWPRGINKNEAHINQWAKALAPSKELRMWFNHDPEKWYIFKQRYINELNTNTKVLHDVLGIQEKAKNEKVTLLFAAKDNAHNNAIVLKEFIERS